ncbi:MAG: oligoribonuclease [Proteobacteria bacterium]|nr:oligoribonuclease [Pseudomonadota bacterium]
MARSIHQPLIWIDCEMTGLDTRKDRIIEIATLITDSELNVIAEGPEIAVKRPQALLDTMDDWNTKHHTQSGLVDRVLNSDIDIEAADRLTFEFISQYTEPHAAPLCGNSVWQDRRFIDLEMPLTAHHLYYRNVDVSSFKEMARRWFPKLEPYKKENHHRALDDIRESIEELKYYRKMIFVPQFPVA